MCCSFRTKFYTFRISLGNFENKNCNFWINFILSEFNNGTSEISTAISGLVFALPELSSAILEINNSTSKLTHTILLQFKN